jgi:hypothetical protein
MPLSRQNKITVAGSRDEIMIVDPDPDPAGMDEDHFVVIFVEMLRIGPALAGIDPADSNEIGQFRITFQNLIERQRDGRGIGFMGGPDFNLRHGSGLPGAGSSSGKAIQVCNVIAGKYMIKTEMNSIL